MVALCCNYSWHLIFVGGAILCLYSLAHWNQCPGRTPFSLRKKRGGTTQVKSPTETEHQCTHKVTSMKPIHEGICVDDAKPFSKFSNISIFNFCLCMYPHGDVCAATKEWSTTFQQESKIINRIENRNKCSILFARRTLVSLGQNCRMFFSFHTALIITIAAVKAL